MRNSFIEFKNKGFETEDIPLWVFMRFFVKTVDASNHENADFIMYLRDIWDFRCQSFLWGITTADLDDFLIEENKITEFTKICLQSIDIISYNFKCDYITPQQLNNLNISPENGYFTKPLMVSEVVSVGKLFIDLVRNMPNNRIEQS